MTYDLKNILSIILILLFFNSASKGLNNNYKNLPEKDNGSYLALPYAQNFNVPTIPDGWTQSSSVNGKWKISNSSYSGGSANEMRLTYSPGDGATRLVLGPINTIGVTQLKLSFKHFFDDYGQGVNYKIQSSPDGAGWTDEEWVNSSGNGNAGPLLVNTTIQNNLGTNTYIAWVIEGDHYQFDNWFIDEVLVTIPQLLDAGMVSIDIPFCNSIGAITPKATIKNLGTGVATFDIIMKLNNGYSSTKTIIGMYPGEIVQIIFDNMYPNPGEYTVEVFTNLSGDSNRSNDSLKKNIGVYKGVWSNRADCPVNSYFSSGVSYNDISGEKFLFLLGGNTNSGTGKECFRYSLSSNSWINIAEMPVGRRVHASAISGDQIFVFGGSDMNANYSSDVYTYNITLDEWNTAASLPQNIGWGKAVYFNGKIYLAGGINSASTILAMVYVYDITTNSWSMATPMPGARFGGAFSIVDNMLIYIGGASATGITKTIFKGIIDKDNPQLINWIISPSMIPQIGNEITGQSGVDAAIVEFSKGIEKKAEYSVENLSYYPAGSMYRFDAAVWGFDGIIVVGGSPASEWTPGTRGFCYIYKPYTDIWIKQFDLPTPVFGSVIGSFNNLTSWNLVSVGGFNTTGINKTQVYLSPTAKLNLRIIPEGFYDTVNDIVIPDTVSVNLKSAAAPYRTIELSKAMTNTAGNCEVYFLISDNVSDYYLAVNHRNSIEVWSSLTQRFSNDVLSYDFTTAANKAYGNNMILRGSRWCIYSGDVNQDGQVTLDDLLLADFDNQNFSIGYLATDVNGDGSTSVFDLWIVDESNQNFISVARP